MRRSRRPARDSRAPRRRRRSSRAAAVVGPGPAGPHPGRRRPRRRAPAGARDTRQERVPRRLVRRPDHPGDRGRRQRPGLHPPGGGGRPHGGDRQARRRGDTGGGGAGRAIGGHGISDQHPAEPAEVTPMEEDDDGDRRDIGDRLRLREILLGLERVGGGGAGRRREDGAGAGVRRAPRVRPGPGAARRRSSCGTGASPDGYRERMERAAARMGVSDSEPPARVAAIRRGLTAAPRCAGSGAAAPVPRRCWHRNPPALT